MNREEYLHEKDQDALNKIIYNDQKKIYCVIVAINNTKSEIFHFMRKVSETNYSCIVDHYALSNWDFNSDKIDFQSIIEDMPQYIAFRHLKARRNIGPEKLGFKNFTEPYDSTIDC